MRIRTRATRPLPSGAVRRALALAYRGARRRIKVALIQCVNPLMRVNRAPIFLLGNQKSGTSAICELLGMSTGIAVTTDLKREVGGQFYLSVAQGDVPFRTLVRRNRWDLSRDIVKEANLTLLGRELKRHFPGARYVMIVRDPRDNIRSILDRVKVPGNLEALVPDAAYDIGPGWAVVLGSAWPGVTVRSHYIEQLAERWNACADVYLRAPGDMLLVRYEDFAADKEGTIEGLARALGLAPRHAIGDKVDVQFQPRGNHGVSWGGFFGAPNLARIEQICGSRMAAFGYRAGVRGGRA